MGRTVKQAADASAPSAPSAASPLPEIAIKPGFAAGKKGPIGTSPRTNYSRVNTTAPPTPDAGAQAQKSMAPLGAGMLPQKVASFSSEEFMGTMTQRPRLQDMVKTAMANTVGRMDITAEAARQAANMGEEPVAEKTAATEAPTEKRASSEYALKLASAVEFIVDNLGKEAALVEGPPGVSQSNKTERFPPHQGQGHHQPPMNPALRKGLVTEQSPTQLANDLEHTPGGNERMIQTNYGKKTAAPVIGLIRKTATVARLGEKKASVATKIRQTVKQAEDRINPAKISAGRAVPPEASASGESGGQPVGGAPQGPTSLIGSNESAMHYKRTAAYANRKQDLKKYFDEPAMSSATDKTLAQAFEHTPEAGTKFSSAELSTKTAAAKALIAKLADETQAAAEQRSA
jgi:hypothetical protein